MAGRPADHAGAFRRRLNLVVFPALLSPALLLLFGPSTVYRANQREFSALFTDIAWPWLLLAVGVAWVMLLSVGSVLCLLADRLARLYAALLFAVGVLLWAQGNLLVADYGLLTGEGLDLSRQTWRVPYETALWVGGVGLAAVYARAVSTMARFGSQLLIALQAVVLVSTLGTAGGEAQVDTPAWSRQPPEDIYALSRQHNVMHIVLDGFPSGIFAELMAQERSTFDRDFSGFSFFADHLGAFPTTRASMPAMLTGMAYRNERPLNDFTRENLRDRSIFRVLAGYGYTIHSVSFHGIDHPPAVFPTGRSTVRYTIPTPYGSRRAYLKFAAAQLVDLSVFRHVPHGIKPGSTTSKPGCCRASTRSRRRAATRGRAITRRSSQTTRAGCGRRQTSPCIRFFMSRFLIRPWSWTRAARLLAPRGSTRRATPRKLDVGWCLSRRCWTGCGRSASTTAAWCSWPPIMGGTPEEPTPRWRASRPGWHPGSHRAERHGLVGGQAA